MKDINEYIKGLKYAKKLHLAEIKYLLNEHNSTIKEKDYIIDCLKAVSNNKKIHPVKIKKIKNILNKWKERHLLWIDLVKKNKEWSKKGGGITWHKKWLKTYEKIEGIFNNY